MSVLLNIEKGKKFSVPCDELFQICEVAVRSLGLNITRTESSAGILEARVPSKWPWPFRSKEGISLSVSRESRVVAIAKVDMKKAAAEGLLVDRFFTAVKKLLADRPA